MTSYKIETPALKLSIKAKRSKMEEQLDFYRKLPKVVNKSIHVFYIITLPITDTNRILNQCTSAGHLVETTVNY